MEVPLQLELTECLVNARYWLLCMGANLIGDICWGHREPQSAGETCPLQIVFALGMFCSVQSLSHVRLFATLWTVAPQGSLGHSWSLGKLMSIELAIPSNHLILCHPLSSCLQSCPVTGSFLMNHSSHQLAKVLEVQFQHWSFQLIFRIDFL